MSAGILANVLPSPVIIYLPNSGAAWVVFDCPAIGNVVVSLTSDDVGVVTVPVSVTVLDGELVAEFLVTAVDQGTTIIRAIEGLREETTQVEVRPALSKEQFEDLVVSVEEVTNLSVEVELS